MKTHVGKLISNLVDNVRVSTNTKSWGIRRFRRFLNTSWCLAEMNPMVVPRSSMQGEDVANFGYGTRVARRYLQDYIWTSSGGQTFGVLNVVRT